MCPLVSPLVIVIHQLTQLQELVTKSFSIDANKIDNYAVV